MRVYCASKLQHAGKWVTARESGIDVISTWIDNPTIPDTQQEMSELWLRCIAEASSAHIILAYREPKDILKGSFIEIGAGLANGATIYAVGFNDYTFAQHPNVTIFPTLDDALIAIENEMQEEEHNKMTEWPDPVPSDANTFVGELTSLINRYSKENESNTPDFILASHVERYMATLGSFMEERDSWYGLNKTSTIHQLSGEGLISLSEPEEANPAIEAFEFARGCGAVKQYQKIGKYRARLAIPGKEYVTEIKGEVETKITAQEGDYEVEGSNLERYIISEKKLNERYVWVNNERDGWATYDAIGRVWAFRYNGDSFTFKAPWGEEMICNHNDFICSPHLDKTDDVYRIENETFMKSYQQLPKMR